MSDYTKIVIESDTEGRINIQCENENGAGHGHRLAGPKYGGGGGTMLSRVELAEDDIDALREYIGIWDEIQKRKDTASK